MKVYKSPQRDIDIPNLDILTLLFESDWCLARETTQIHVEAADPSNAITKSEARTLTKRIGHIFRHRFGIGSSGLGKDTVLTLLHGSPFAPVLFYGLVAAGGVYSGASTESSVSEMVRQIKDAKASMIVCSPDCASRALEAADKCGISKDRVLLLDSLGGPRTWSLISAADSANLLDSRPEQLLEWKRIETPQELAATTICLLYSSGTTGLPKGVRISHRSLVANNICTMDPARRFKANEARAGRSFIFDTIAHLPIANIARISLYATNPFYMGGTTYWMSYYDFDLFLELIKYKGAQVAPAELEALLCSNPRIADAAVIGVWDEEGHTEVPRAFVVRRLHGGSGEEGEGEGGGNGGRGRRPGDGKEEGDGEENPITATEVMSFVAERVASYKRLRGGVVFVDEIPKSASGKILRKELRGTGDGGLRAREVKL